MAMSDEAMKRALHEATQPFENALPGGYGRVRKNYQHKDYIPHEDVTAELNKAFSPFGWSTYIDQLQQATCTQVGKNIEISYQVVLRLEIHEVGNPSNVYATRTEVGFENGEKKKAGDAAHAAIGGAASRALRRAAMRLGERFGLALYFAPGEANARGMLGSVIEYDRYTDSQDPIPDKPQQAQQAPQNMRQARQQASRSDVSPEQAPAILEEIVVKAARAGHSGAKIAEKLGAPQKLGELIQGQGVGCILDADVEHLRSLYQYGQSLGASKPQLDDAARFAMGGWGKKKKKGEALATLLTILARHGGFDDPSALAGVREALGVEA